MHISCVQSSVSPIIKPTQFGEDNWQVSLDNNVNVDKQVSPTEVAQ